MKFLALLTPFRCRLIFVLLMVLNFYGSWRYLTHHCPIDLSGDEAQYWGWSRHPDLCYYSKGPMVAYIIRASCHFLGDTMPAVRLPALLFAIGTSVCTYWLTRKLFGSDRLALGAVLIGGIVPMYAAGGMLMTIDPPLFFFWALATCLASVAIFDGKRWAWPAAGIVAGLGVLTKYAMLLWPPFVLLFLIVDPVSRAKLGSAGPWVMTIISLVFLTPVMIWNARHGWVSFQHVATQTSGGFGHGDLFPFLAAQVAVINPALAALMLAAVVYAMFLNDPRRQSLQFLVCIGGFMFLACLLDSAVAKVQVNWPAPAYFTLMILTAYFIAAMWDVARGWFIAALVFGIAMQPVVRDMTMLYPLAGWLDRHHPRKPREGTPQSWVHSLDAEYKFRGIADPFAKSVDAELAKMPAGSFVLCEAYEDASEMEFYLQGHPKTYFAGSYWTAPFPIRRRWTQFDIWPDRSLDQPALIGHDAIYIGFAGYAPLKQSFASMEKLPDIVVTVNGMQVQRFAVWKCLGFTGMHRPGGPSPR
jgi:hypothetical protein